MNILYLHGLDSSLSPEKQAILEKHGKIFSPAIDYRNNYDSISILINQFKNEKISVVIGSSMGGYAAYYVSDSYSVPALLFNPALAARSVFQKTPNIPEPYLSYKQFVLGLKDDVVEPATTLNFLSGNLQRFTDYNIRIIQNLAHQIPVDIFEREVDFFFKMMKTQ